MLVTQADFIQKKILLPDETEVRSVHEAIVLTSKTAVHVWVAIAAKIHSNPQHHRAFCLDRATHQEALHYHLPIAGLASNAAALAEVILKQSAIRAVTFFCSNLHRTELPDQLKNAGIIVDEWVVYETILTPQQIKDPAHGVLFFSPSAVDSFLSLNAVNGATGFCIGSTTDEHARQRGFTQSVVAEIPSPESLIQGTINYYTPYSLHA